MQSSGFRTLATSFMTLWSSSICSMASNMVTTSKLLSAKGRGSLPIKQFSLNPCFGSIVGCRGQHQHRKLQSPFQIVA